MREKSAAEHRRKIDQLVECEGYSSVDELLEATAIDSVSSASHTRVFPRT